jgi:hypothetical protein
MEEAANGALCATSLGGNIRDAKTIEVSSANHLALIISELRNRKLHRARRFIARSDPAGKVTILADKINEWADGA